MGAGITANTFADADKLAVIARFGVGYDKVDVEACTENGVLLTIAPDGVRRPVATSIMTLVLSLSHQLLIKDRLIRAGGWRNTQNYRGMGLVGRNAGACRLGNIGKEAFKLAKPFGMRHITSDPYVTPAEAAEVGVDSLNWIP